MELTSKHNDKIVEMLSIFDIAHQVEDGIIWVNRTSMVQKMSDSGEQSGYDNTLLMLKECVSGDYVCWGGRSDEVMCVEVYAK